jgi:hypothetical protein
LLDKHPALADADDESFDRLRWARDAINPDEIGPADSFAELAATVLFAHGIILTDEATGRCLNLR